jgi:two-component system CheB/CheR fusion protein
VAHRLPGGLPPHGPAPKRKVLKMTKRRAGTGRIEDHGAAELGVKAVHKSFPVVGIGASAGGLEAISKLLDALPGDTGMAFILVQHLDPTHASMMVDLLSSHTKMTVLQAVNGMPLECDRFYIIPPGVNMSIQDDKIRLSELHERYGARRPFDFFLKSLAEECGKRTICAILSGTGDDGSRGLQAVLEKGGLVIAQDPDEAAYDGMPRSAITTGAVDLVLSVTDMAAALVKYSRQPYVRTTHKTPAPDDRPSDGLGEIIGLLREKTMHDFTLYKQGTLSRRIERRMAILGLPDSESYLGLLRSDPITIDMLVKDLLIHVTGFFRDLKAFELLAEKILPEMVKRHPAGRALRVWVPACSTGEETYSIAMLFLEAIAAAKRNIKLQVFASDVDEGAVSDARAGLYPQSIEADVTPERLERFFAREGHGYRVSRDLREVVVFTVQDLLADAPFSRLDLVSCRNLLIYLLPEVQERVISMFHFALREAGVLLLGSAETVGRLGTHFATISKAERIYRHVGQSRPGEVHFPIGTADGARALWPRAARPKAPPQRASLGELALQQLIETYVPVSVLVNGRHECLHSFGATDRYLQVAPGESSRDVIAMAREGLRAKLRSALHRAAKDRTPTTITGAKVVYDRTVVAVSICVRPTEVEGEELMLVSFIDEPAPERQPRRAGASNARKAQVTELEDELDATRNELEGAIRDLEIANEDHKAINEEAMSVNEEYQSSNEELETSKEELQSLNEELTTLNHQIQEALEQQRDTTNDLQNVMNSSDVAMLFLDTNLRIRFFTPATTSLFRLIASDIGRPLEDFTPHFVDKNILTDARTVLRDPGPIGCEIRTEGGDWYIRRVLPYRTLDGRIDGVVITFSDISEMKAAEHKIVAARALADSIINSIHQPLVVLDDELRVVAAGRSFYGAFNTTAEHTLGKRLWDTDEHHLDVPGLHAFLQRIRSERQAIDNYEIEIDMPPLGKRRLLLDACDIQGQPGSKRQILVAIDDITERKQAESALGAARADAERANLGKSRFLAAASHDLRQPLQTISLMQGVLLKRVTDKSTVELIGKLGDTVGAMSGMLNTLLDINELEAGMVVPHLVDFPINALLDRLKTEFAYHTGAKGLGWRVVPCHMSIHSDRTLFEQMVRNLLSNAVKYTARGKILIGCRQRGDRLRVEVWDTGLGIPSDQLQTIFEEFRQLNNPARERSRGLGLGLSLVQRLGTLLGVSVDVRSRLGSGSVFSVEVPLAEGALIARIADDRPRDGGEMDPHGSLLLIEDDPMLLELLALLFQDEGHRVAIAQDGEQAMAMVATGELKPDVIVADYNLPGGMNGLQVIQSLRETLQRDIPAVIITGDISTVTSRNIAPTNCMLLNKPVESDTLISLINGLLAAPRPGAERAAA